VFFQFYIIADGKISYSTLNELGKDKKWLFKKLKLRNKKLKDIIFAIYDEKADEIEVCYK